MRRELRKPVENLEIEEIVKVVRYIVLRKKLAAKGEKANGY